MRPPCEIVARDILPAIRSLVAKELIERYGLTQMAAAKKLGLSQAAISYYMDTKRGGRLLSQMETTPAIIKGVDELAEGIAKDSLSEEDVALKFCQLCESLRKHE